MPSCFLTVEPSVRKRGRFERFLSLGVCGHAEAGMQGGFSASPCSGDPDPPGYLDQAQTTAPVQVRYGRWRRVDGWIGGT